MNVTPISLGIVPHPNIIKDPNVAHISFSIFFCEADTSLLSKIANHVSLYVYLWHIKSKWQLKHVVTFICNQ